MAELKDERGNPIYLTDQHGKPAQLIDEFGNAMYLKGVATTVPHLKESSDSGPHPITAPITTTNTPYHAKPINVSHNNPLDQRSSSTDEDGEGEWMKTNTMDDTKSNVGGNKEPSVHENKGFFHKIMDKFSGHHHHP